MILFIDYIIYSLNQYIYKSIPKIGTYSSFKYVSSSTISIMLLYSFFAISRIPNSPTHFKTLSHSAYLKYVTIAVAAPPIAIILSSLIALGLSK